MSWEKMIKRLPSYKAPCLLWDKIVLKLQAQSDDSILEEALSLLKSYNASDDIWNRINSRLDTLNQDVLASAIKDLPDYKMRMMDFESFKSTYTEKNVAAYYSLLQVAASVIVGLFLVYALVGDFPKRENVNIVYSQEYMEDFDVRQTTPDTFSEPDDILSYIDKNCHSLSTICTTDRFKMLYEKYLGLLAAQQDLAQSVSSQNEIYMTRYKIRIEKQQAEIGKDLIAYFTES